MVCKLAWFYIIEICCTLVLEIFLEIGKGTMFNPIWIGLMLLQKMPLMIFVCTKVHFDVKLVSDSQCATRSGFCIYVRINLWSPRGLFLAKYPLPSSLLLLMSTPLPFMEAMLFMSLIWSKIFQLSNAFSAYGIAYSTSTQGPFRNDSYMIKTRMVSLRKVQHLPREITWFVEGSWTK